MKLYYLQICVQYKMKILTIGVDPPILVSVSVLVLIPASGGGIGYQLLEFCGIGDLIVL